MKLLPYFVSIAIAEFVATKDWQVIPENEPLPAGLHYRMNFETGVKEAKLLGMQKKIKIKKYIHIIFLRNSSFSIFRYFLNLIIKNQTNISTLNFQ